MSIKVKVSLILRQFTNGQELVEVTGQNPIECLHDFVAQFPDAGRWLFDEQGEVRPQVWFFVNGEEVHANKATNPLKDGDELFILLAIGGG